MSQTRQLAAIMFTDIVGYTALMGKDEQKAFELLEKNRQLEKLIIDQHHGRIIKEIGDGTLSSFATVTDAVYAGLKIQETCLQSGEFFLRIGIHHGEVVFEDNDVFGDVVNIASRLQSIAPPGGIYVSESVEQNVKNRNDIRTLFVKEEKLKNVEKPEKIFQVLRSAEPPSKINSAERTEIKSRYLLNKILIFSGIIVVFALSYWGYLYYSKIPSETSSVASEKSIAVLPFKLIGNDQEGRYLADGVADALLNHLTNIENLRVRSRTSVEKYAEAKKSIPEIAEELKVDYILEGSVQKYKDDIRIIVQLINAKTDDHLWQNEYNKKYDDIFNVQSEIALNIFSHLNIAITGKQKQRIEKIPTRNKEAWDLFLRGKEYMRSWWKFHEMKDLEFAETFFTQSIKRDSIFPLGYTWLALAKYNRGLEDSCLFLVQRSIKLDPDLSLSYQLLASNAMFKLKDPQKSKEYIDKAIRLDPENPDVLRTKADYFWQSGNTLEALSILGTAMKKEPSEFYPYLLHQIGLTYMSISDFDLAEKFYHKALQLQPDNLDFLTSIAYLYLLRGDDNYYYQVIQKIQSIRRDNLGLESKGRYYLLKGEYLEAEMYYSQYFSLPIEKVREGIQEKSAYAAVLRKLGKEKEALRQIYAAKDFIENNLADPNYDLAKVYSFLGEKEKALDYLSKWKPDWGLYHYIERDPLFENISNEPEFKRQVKRIQAEFDEMKKQAHARIKTGEFPSPEMIVQ